MNTNRRTFLVKGAFGVAAAGVGALVLNAEAGPTEASGDLGAYGEYFPTRGVDPNLLLPSSTQVTERSAQGPFFRVGAPFRAKISPPLEPGTVLVVKGRIWGYDTRQPLERAVVDVWQANATGRYDNHDGDPENPEAFANRGRLVTDENGYYEFETVRPGAYEFVPGRMRPAHIHYWVRHHK